MSNINMGDIMVTAMMQALDQGKRDELIKEAIKHIIEKPKDNYGTPRSSPLELAFHYAVDQAAKEIVSEEIKRPEVRDRIQEAVRVALTKFLDTEKLGEAMANNLWSMFDEKKYR